MILYIRKTSNFEQVENFLLNHPDQDVAFPAAVGTECLVVLRELLIQSRGTPGAGANVFGGGVVEAIMFVSEDEPCDSPLNMDRSAPGCPRSTVPRLVDGTTGRAGRRLVRVRQ